MACWIKMEKWWQSHAALISDLACVGYGGSFGRHWCLWWWQGLGCDDVSFKSRGLGNLTRDVVKSVGYSNSNKHRRKEDKGHKKDRRTNAERARSTRSKSMDGVKWGGNFSSLEQLSRRTKSQRVMPTGAGNATCQTMHFACTTVQCLYYIAVIVI